MSNSGTGGKIRMHVCMIGHGDTIRTVGLLHVIETLFTLLVDFYFVVGVHVHG